MKGGSEWKGRGREGGRERRREGGRERMMRKRQADMYKGWMP